MAWTRAGTINVTFGSPAVVGVGTSWLQGVDVGSGLNAPDGHCYEILSIDGPASLTMAEPYKGSTAGTQQYSIMPTQSYMLDLVERINTLIGTYKGIVTGAGAGNFGPGTSATPSIRGQADQDTGVNLPGGDTVQVQAGGVTTLQASPTDVRLGVPSLGFPQAQNNAALEDSDAHLLQPFSFRISDVYQHPKAPFQYGLVMDALALSSHTHAQIGISSSGDLWTRASFYGEVGWPRAWQRFAKLNVDGSLTLGANFGTTGGGYFGGLFTAFAGAEASTGTASTGANQASLVVRELGQAGVQDHQPYAAPRLSIYWAGVFAYQFTCDQQGAKLMNDPGTNYAGLRLGYAQVNGQLSVNNDQGGPIATFGASTVAASYTVFYKGGTTTAVGLIGTDGGAVVGGGAGSNFAIRSYADLIFLAETGVIRPASDGGMNLGTSTYTWAQVHAQEFRSYTDIWSQRAGAGVLMRSPNGTLYRVAVTDAGVLQAVST